MRHQFALPKIIQAPIGSLASGTLAAAVSTRNGAHPAYKPALVEARSADTVLTGCFDGEWPYALHGVLRNSTPQGWEAAGCPPPGHRCGARRLHSVCMRPWESTRSTHWSPPRTSCEV